MLTAGVIKEPRLIYNERMYAAVFLAVIRTYLIVCQSTVCVRADLLSGVNERLRHSGWEHWKRKDKHIPTDVYMCNMHVCNFVPHYIILYNNDLEKNVVAIKAVTYIYI